MNRRTFIDKTAIGVTGTILPLNGIFNIISKDKYPSTKDFWYRRVNEGPFIDTQLGNKAFGFTKKEIFLSHDNCETWSNHMRFWDAENITFSHIFRNGNILIGTRNRLYLS